ncbi:MAG: restriction endonuclease subunit S [Nitrososphaeraceae archaeon]
MVNEWKEYPFDEVIDFQEGPGILAKDFRDKGIPLIRLSGLERGSSIFNGCNYLDPEMVKQKWSHFSLQEGDILLSTSASLGRIAVVRREGIGAITYTGIIRMRSRDASLFRPFIRYLLESPDFQHQVEMMGVGSVIRHFGPMHLRQMSVILPPPDEQRSITHILGTLDDKIEINQEMNKTLESIAQAIFKYWFIDFEFPNEEDKPYKSSGGEMVYNKDFEKDIPKGWQVKELPEVAKIVDCLHITKPIETKNEAYLLQVFNIVEYGLIDLSKKFHVSDEAYEFWTKNIEVVEGDCIISNAGRVGAIGQIPYWLKGGIGRNITAVRPVTITPTYLVEYLFSKFGQQEIEKQTDSATVLNTLNVRGIKKIKILIPHEKMMKKYEEISRPIRKKMEVNYINMSNLISLRDSLLPRLLSGKIRVPLEVR